MASDFHHVFLPGDGMTPALLLLHGTGADEHDLIDLGRAVAPESAVLSVRGKVSENGQNRFFRRLAEGVFDLEDLAFRADELADFIVHAKTQYAITQPLYALGYSNGANIAARLLFQRPETLGGAILLRAMMPWTPEALPDLKNKPVLLLSGLMDPLIPREGSEALVEWLGKTGAAIRHIPKPTGHGMIPSDLADIRQWFKDNS